jgi:putative tributyrin esterase
MSFRFIELSDPRYESQGLRHLTFHSSALRGRGDVTLFVPDDVPPGTTLPLVILLHGGRASHWSWACSGGVHRRAETLIDSGEIEPVVIAMPSDGMRGDGTGYLHWRDVDVESWIMDDVVACVRHIVPQAGGALFLAGLSMGGYASLRLGAKYAHAVRGISAHSSVTTLDHLLPLLARSRQEIAGEHADPVVWIERNRSVLPPLRFDCGLEDGLLAANRELHLALDERGIQHTYAEHPGGHDWTYWSEHVVTTLRFFGSLATPQ